jgi:hypothetical protein
MIQELTLSKYSDLAYRAYYNTSFSPEKRRDQIIKEHSAELDSDLLKIKEEADKERYKQGYEKYFSAWLGAKSRCISSMITGPANFPVRRAEKANDMEAKRSVEFSEWRERALKAIAKKERIANEPLKESKQSEKETINGVELVKNFDADRMQIFFNGKPSIEVIQKLKKNAWRWSPFNKCWQRKLTNNAISDAKYILK